MRKVREVLRLHFECGCKHRQISAACGVSPSTVTDYLERARRAGMTWEQARTLKDSEVEARLFTLLGRSEPAARAPIDFEWIHRELARVGVSGRIDIVSDSKIGVVEMAVTRRFL
jgi:DNA-binding transcriptional regulator LsrR (DeoR family)